MDLLSKDDIKALSEEPADLCVSIFMPTHRTGKEIEQDPIRLKNLLRSVEKGLKERGIRDQQIQSFLEPPRHLLGDDFFWSHQHDGLAIFLTAENFQCYRLPLKFDELNVVSQRFHLKPLLPILSSDVRFYILALSQKTVRLLEGSRYNVSQVVLKDIPQSLSEALKYDDPERQLQFHTGAQPAKGGRRAAMFHGQGVGMDAAQQKKDILRFFQLLDQGLHDILHEQGIPLIIAGVEYLHPIYREANSYPQLLERGIVGNPEELSNEELHRAAWTILEPHFQKNQEQARAKYQELAGTGRASKKLQEVVPATHHGKVEQLFVPREVQIWGRYDQDSSEVHIHEGMEPDDEELLDLCAIQTFLTGGTVYAVDRDNMPDDTSIAAVFRY
ncbi:hypothetical protein GWO43_00350 [candidate division KSB1 bacterium]|nr:hypothetical protein [candidate division KSB1 bacterium]NIR68517.1 hypothetical protein [candidate division KSB1 bacterium]NIS22531.1 hypothetical protein [candidate division KSB1 bacterium]NIT69375.1 hypothetical protein [candidate division KSB1 bacterium]NIU23036.1 hypothetical protein [candidate division KSB1 bacterium]